MKHSTIFCALIAMTVGAQLLSANTTDNETPDTQTADTTAKPWSGMYFSSEYVTEEYEYDDAYCLVYDDPDADMHNTEILVDLETYQLVLSAIATNTPLIGSLVLSSDYTTEGQQIFTYLPDPELEMATASAKYCVIDTNVYTIPR